MAKTDSQLGELLKERRRARGLSRARVAEALAIPAGTIEGWEIGRVAKPPIHDVLRLARLLGITTAEIDEVVLGPEAAATNGAAPAPVAGGAALVERVIGLYGWREDQLAAALGTTTSRVLAMRHGKQTVKLAEAMALAALVGVHAASSSNGDSHGTAWELTAA